MLNTYWKQFKSGTDIRGVASEGVAGQEVNLTDEAIEKMADEQRDFDEIRKAFPDFEELDGDYYDVADEDLEIAAAYVQANWDKFAKLSG